MTDIIWKALGIILSAIVSFVLGRLQAKYSALKKEKEQKAVEDKAEVKKAYKLYHDTYLHGNGAGTMYYEAIMKLPDE